MAKDYYKILGIEENATTDDIKKAYRQLVHKYHPDIAGNTPEIIEKFKKYGIEPKKIQFIYPKDNKNSDLFLIEGVKNGKVGLKILPNLVLHNDDGTYKENVRDLFRE